MRDGENDFSGQDNIRDEEEEQVDNFLLLRDMLPL